MTRGPRAAAVALSLVALGACARTRTPQAPLAGCRVGAAAPLGRDPDEVPVGLAAARDGVWAITLRDDPAGGATAALVRANGSRGERVREVRAASRAAVSDLVLAPAGPVFAVAARDGIRLVAAGGAASEPRFPRGDVPAGREDVVPTLALARGIRGGYAALAGFGAAFGIHRLHSVDVGESVAYTPRRADTFTGPSLAVVGDVVLVAQRRRVAPFGDGAAREELELVALEAAPFAPRVPSLLTVARLDAGFSGARVAAADSGAAITGATVTWADRAGAWAALAHRAPGSAPRVALVGDTLQLDARADAGVPAAVALPRGCGLLYAWTTRDGLALRRALPGARGLEPSGDALRVALTVRTGDRLGLTRTGDRVVAALDAAGTVRVFDAVLDAACAVTLRPLPLPAPAARAHLVGLAADDARAVLAVASPGPDGGSIVAFTTILPDGTWRVAPPPEPLASDVRALAVQPGAALVLAGAAEHRLRLDRLAADDETLVIHGSRGADFDLAAGGQPSRVFAADALDGLDPAFGPAQSVVLHSFVAELEDGPRTEDRTAVVPWADFARLTLDAVRTAPGEGEADAWAATFSRGVSGDSGCIPGIALVLADARDDHPRAPAQGAAASPRWPEARALVAASEASCDDRVGAVTWAGPRFALTAAGPRLGAVLILGDVRSAALRTVRLAPPSAGLRAPGLARAGEGLVVARATADARVVVQRFDAQGDARGAEITLAERARLGTDGPHPVVVVTAQSPRAALVGYPSSTGARLVRIECADPP